MARECLLSPAVISSVSKIVWNTAALNQGTASSEKPSSFPPGLWARDINPQGKVSTEEEASPLFIHTAATFTDVSQGHRLRELHIIYLSGQPYMAAMTVIPISQVGNKGSERSAEQPTLIPQPMPFKSLYPAKASPN